LEAWDNFEMALRLDPGNAQYSKAADRVNTRSLQKAREGASSLPKTAELLMTQADLYLSKGRPDLAQKELEQALKSQPQNTVLREKLAALKRASSVPGDKAELAEHLYDQGLQKYLEGDLDGSILCWQKAVKANPGNMKAQNNLVHAQLEKEAEKQ
jgi:tetratricopeptide (TPR) repeat protein